MEVSGGIVEDGTVVGNTYDKYGSSNPIVKRIMAGFEASLDDLVGLVDASTVHEIGCGEGYWCLKLLRDGRDVRGSDVSSEVIKIAQNNAEQYGQPIDRFTQRSIYDLTPEIDGAELIVCCEVLEHLEDPEQGLDVLHKVTGKNLIVSVPREPLWRALNLVRGKYIGSLGNTPGHLQHWSKGGFKKFMSRKFEIAEIRSPLPWTMLLCKPR